MKIELLGSVPAVQSTAAVAATSSRLSNAADSTGYVDVPAPVPAPIPIPAPSAPAPAPALPSTGLSASAKEALDSANRQLQQSDRELTFQFDDTIGRVVFKLIDTSTKEVLRTLPSKEFIEAARALASEQQSGVLIKAQA